MRLCRVVRLSVVFGLFAMLLSTSNVWATASEWMQRVGTIGNALSLEDGSQVCLDAVVVDKIKVNQEPAYFTIHECFNTKDKLVVLTVPSSELRMGMGVDISGTISTLSNGERAIINPTVYGYTDEDGNLLRHGPLIKGLLEPTPWQWKVNLTVAVADSSNSSSTLPDTTPAKGPDYYAKISDVTESETAQTQGARVQTYYPGVGDLQGLANDSLVELQCKRITAVGTETINGATYNYLDVTENSPSTDTIRAYYTGTAAVTDRINKITGQIQHVGTTPVLCIDTGPDYNPQILEGTLQTATEGTIAWVKTFPNGSEVSIAGKVVTTCRTDLSGDRLYVEEQNRSAGILVHYSGTDAYAWRNYIVNVTGIVNTLSSGERWIEAGTDGVTDTQDYLDLGPLGMPNRAVGGGDFNVLSTGIDTPTAYGLNNIGLYVRIWGRVTGAYPDEKCFYIDDGTGLDDTNSHGVLGLKVCWDWQNTDTAMEVTPPLEGCYVMVNGFSSAETLSSGGVIRALRVRNQDDVTYSPSDTTPPNPGTASVAAYTTSSPITVTYSGAYDDYSGINHIELYYKHGESGEWTYGASTKAKPEGGISVSSASISSELSSQPQSSGSFSFTPNSDGTHYFRLIAEDNAGNWSNFSSENGDCYTVYDPTIADTDTTARSYEHIEYLYPGGPVMSRSIYSENGNRFRRAIYNYGTEGELLSINGDATPVSYTYNSAYQLTSITDGNYNTTVFTYDDDGDSNTYDAPLGLLTRIDYPGGETVQFPTHDAAGRVLKRIDPNQVVTQYAYSDTEGLLTDITYPATPALNTHFDYDSVYGRLTQATDGSGTRSLEYDNRDALLSETTTYTGLASKTVGYEFYPDGSLMTLSTPAGDFGYTYDAVGRPTGMTNPSDSAFSWSYRSNNWLDSQTTPVSKATCEYNTRGFLTGLTNAKSDNTLLSQFTIPADTTGYDAACSILSMTASIPNVATTFSGTTSYSYSSLNQLTSEQSTRNSNYNYSFVYDNSGNATTFRSSSKTYNSNNQNTAFTYNANGNPTLYNSNSLTYDPENRLTSFGTVMTAGYTSDGLRAWKESTSGRTYYLYSGWTPICEMDSSGNITTINTFGPTGLLARREGTTDTFYTFDTQGSVSQTLNSSGNITATQLYDAYGSLLLGTASYPFGFGAQNGYYTDQETGLKLLTHRYYDPAEGRFLTKDPVSYAGGVNLYAYTNGDPVNIIDPSGYCGDKKEESALQRMWDWYLHDSVVPGPYGQPTAEWGSNGPTSWGDPMRYTDGTRAENLEKGLVYGSTGLAVVTLGAGIAEMAGIIDTAPQANNVIRVISKVGKWGARMDKAHHGKPWGHLHFWKW